MIMGSENCVGKLNIEEKKFKKKEALKKKKGVERKQKRR